MRSGAWRLTARLTSPVKLPVLSGLLQLGGEVAHGREDERDLLLVVFDVSGLVADLHHQHDGIGLGLAAQRGEGAGELIA